MEDDKRIVDVNEHFLKDEPEPIRQMAKYGRVWGVAMDKRPILPMSWKKHSEKLMIFTDAVGKRDALKANGQNVVLYYVLGKTPIRTLDFDPDKETGQLTVWQEEVLDHYRNVHKAPIEVSLSGVGRHVYLFDNDKQLPKIGDTYVKGGSSPFEIKHDLIYVTGKWEQVCPIPAVDQYTIDIANKAKPPAETKPSKPPVAEVHTPATTIAEHEEREPNTEKAADRLTADLIIKWFKDSKTPLCPTNDSFLIVCHALLTCGYTKEELIKLMRSEEGYTNDAYKRICSFKPEGRQIASLVKYANEHGYNSGKKEKNDETKDDAKPEITVDPRLGKAAGFEHCLNKLGIEIRNNELVGIEVKFPNKEWLELDDAVFDTLSVDYIAKHCFKKVNKQWIPFEIDVATRRQVINNLARKQPSYNETREWLHTIDAKEDWDAIDEYLSCYKIDGYGRLADGGYSDEDKKEYYRAGFVLKMATWIMRSLKPGCLFDKFVIDVGERGCGKGLGLQLNLIPQHVCPTTGEITPNKAYKDGCRLSDDRSAWYHNRRCSLGEVTELIDFNKAGNEKLKSIISATHDHQELKYHNYSVSVPKSYGLIGTTNDRNVKTPDGEGDRRLFVLDLACGFVGGREAVRKMIPAILTDSWRIRAVGHILWLIKNGYCANTKDWSAKVEEMREFMVGQSSKHYPRIEAALLAIANGTVDYLDNVKIRDNVHAIQRKEWKHFGYRDLLDRNGYNAIKRHGLPFNTDRYPENQATWMRLLALYDKALVDRYTADTIKLVATEHLGWEWFAGRKQAHGYKQSRNWLIPGLPEPDARERLEKLNS